MMLEWFCMMSNPNFMEDYIEWLNSKKEPKEEIKEEKKEVEVQPGSGMRF